MVGDGQIGMPESLRGLRHLPDGGGPIAPGGVRVKGAANVRLGNQARQAAFERGLNLAAALAQLRRDVRKAQEGLSRYGVRKRTQTGERAPTLEVSRKPGDMLRRADEVLL